MKPDRWETLAFASIFLGALLGFAGIFVKSADDVLSDNLLKACIVIIYLGVAPVIVRGFHEVYVHSKKYRHEKTPNKTNV